MGKFHRCCGGIVVILLVMAVAVKSCPLGQHSAGSVCSAVLCPIKEVCRVVKESAASICSAEARCMGCVSEGVDKVCNSNDYLYAVLTPLPGVIGKLTDLKCDMAALEETTCPVGSVCLPDGSASGTCCYGKAEPPPGADHVHNSDPVCPDECGGCDPGYECQKRVLPCLVPPCPEHYRCVEKKRSCPVLPAFVPEYCFNNTAVSQCRVGRKCPAKLLCCPDICSVRRCVRGFP